MNKLFFVDVKIIILFLCLLFACPSVNAEDAPGEAPKSKEFINLNECYELALKRSETLAISKEEIEKAEAAFFQATGDAFGDVSFVATSITQDVQKNSRGNATGTDSSVEST